MTRGPFEKEPLERPHLASRGKASFIKRSVCGQADEVFLACCKKQERIERKKLPKPKGIWGAIMKLGDISSEKAEEIENNLTKIFGDNKEFRDQTMSKARNGGSYFQN